MLASAAKVQHEGLDEAASKVNKPTSASQISPTYSIILSGICFASPETLQGENFETKNHVYTEIAISIL